MKVEQINFCFPGKKHGFLGGFPIFLLRSRWPKQQVFQTSWGPAGATPWSPFRIRFHVEQMEANWEIHGKIAGKCEMENRFYGKFIWKMMRKIVLSIFVWILEVSDKEIDAKAVKTHRGR